MAFTTVTRSIAAPRELVFDTIAHIENFAEINPDIVEIEILSDVRRGVGTRFRETRMMGKRKASTILEVTEYEENEHIRIVCDSGGSTWDSLFTLRDANGGTELVFEMDVRPHKLLAKIMNRLFRGMISKAITKDIDRTKEHCEGVATNA